MRCSHSNDCLSFIPGCDPVTCRFAMRASLVPGFIGKTPGCALMTRVLACAVCFNSHTPLRNILVVFLPGETETGDVCSTCDIMWFPVLEPGPDLCLSCTALPALGRHCSGGANVLRSAVSSFVTRRQEEGRNVLCSGDFHSLSQVSFACYPCFLLVIF